MISFKVLIFYTLLALTMANESLVAIGMAPSSPEISANPAMQNNAGDSFDFSTQEGLLGGAGTGFGSWGKISINYDADFFYIGGTELNVSAENNVAIIFLDFNTLTDDKKNLWSLTGAPLALDYLHNVTFAHPMDIAIILGDEYGDSTYPTFQIGSGDTMGQGAYYLSATGFVPVSGVKISQFDGTSNDLTLTDDDDGNRLTDRWEVAIPWASLGASSLADVQSIRMAGVFASSNRSGNDRYLSGQVLAAEVESSAPVDAFENHAYALLSLSGHEITLPNSLSPHPADGAVCQDGNGFEMQWASEELFTYQVYRSFDLQAFSLLAEGVTATTPTNFWCDSNALQNPKAFYIVKKKAPSNLLKLMSFNIRFGSANDGLNGWDFRKNQAYALIRREAPDLIGVQEAERFQLDQLRAALPEYAEIGEGRSGGTHGEYSPILYRTDRLSVQESGTFWLSDTPATPGSTSWGNALPRICTWARLYDLKNGTCFYHFNTHLDHLSQFSREQSIKLIAQRIASRSDSACAYLLTGDFNAGESNSVIRYALSTAQIGGTTASEDGAELRDVFRARHPSSPDVGTIHGFTGDLTGEKIDYIFLSPEWHHSDAQILHDNEAGAYPSDHFPITAELLLLP